MRVSYCFAVRDQNRLVYQADEDFVASLPARLQGPMKRWFERFQMSPRGQFRPVPQPACQHKQSAAGEDPARARQPALVLGRRPEGLAGLSESYDVPMHMHLVETAYQKEYAEKPRRRHGGRVSRPVRPARRRA